MERALRQCTYMLPHVKAKEHKANKKKFIRTRSPTRRKSRREHCHRLMALYMSLIMGRIYILYTLALIARSTLQRQQLKPSVV